VIYLCYGVWSRDEQERDDENCYGDARPSLFHSGILTFAEPRKTLAREALLTQTFVWDDRKKLSHEAVDLSMPKHYDDSDRMAQWAWFSPSH